MGATCRSYAYRIGSIVAFVGVSRSLSRHRYRQLASRHDSVPASPWGIRGAELPGRFTASAWLRGSLIHQVLHLFPPMRTGPKTALDGLDHCQGAECPLELADPSTRAMVRSGSYRASTANNLAPPRRCSSAVSDQDDGREGTGHRKRVAAAGMLRCSRRCGAG